MKIGDKVIVPAGVGYNTFDPFAFRRATKNTPATIFDIRGGSAYITLENGKQAETRLGLLITPQTVKDMETKQKAILQEN